MGSSPLLHSTQMSALRTFLPFTSNSPRSADDYSAAVSTLFQVAKAEQSENLFVHFSLAVAGAFGRVL